jgi:Protein of unknown function (DUF5656)
MQRQGVMRRWVNELRPPRRGLAYVGVRMLVYVLGLLLIVQIYGTKQRGLFTGIPIGLLTAAGTWFLLSDTPADSQRRLALAAAVGLLLAELTWAVGYWSAVPLVGGAALWLAFYVLSGIVEHGAGRSLDRRVGLEYAVVALVGTLLVALIAHPWSL